MPEVGLLPFARVALQVSTAVLPTYRTRFSKHQFTQPQLRAALCLMRYEDWTFREAEVRLREHSELRRVPGLKSVPDYTTLYRFLKRLDPKKIDDAVREAAWRLVGKRPRRRRGVRVANVIDFSSPNGIRPGTGVDTIVTTFVFTGSGVESFNVPNARAHLTVVSASSNNFVLQTDPKRSPLNGTLTFSVTPNANSQVTSSIQAQGNYTSRLSQFLSLLGKHLDDGIWKNLINQIKDYCSKK